MTYYPENWTTQRDALLAWAATSGFPAIWLQQDAPRPAKPYVAIGLVTPPVSIGQTVESNVRAVQVRLVASNTSYVVTINDVPYTYPSDANATLAEVQAGIVDAVNGSLPGTASALGTDVVEMDISPELELTTNDDALLRVKLVQKYIGEAELVVGVDGYTDDRDEQAGAVDGLKLSTETSSVREALAAAGLAAVQIVGSRRLGLVVNGLWEHRYGFDLRLRTLTRRVEIIDLIETIGVDGVQGTISV